MREVITLDYILSELSNKYPLLSDSVKTGIANSILNNLRSDVYRVGLVRSISAKIADNLSRKTNKSIVDLYDNIVINIEHFLLHYRFSSVIN